MLFIQFALLAAAVSALPSSTKLAARQTCTSPRLRKAWSQATDEEKLAYLDAAVCVTKKPSKLNPKATLHDDFAYTHALLDFNIHQFPGFLPWHRYFVMLYEKALQDCGYKGTAMYWDWVADSDDPSRASVWDPVTGFGGNGNGTEGNPNPGNHAAPVRDGPFKDWRPLYAGTAEEQHWLCRAWSRGNPETTDRDLFGHRYTREIVTGILANTSYDGFRKELEGGPHASVHMGVAIGNGRGKQGDLVPSSSPNDPIFFLHHTMVDRLWWVWQQEDESRIKAYEGFHRLPPGAPEGEEGTPVTLKDILPMGDLADDGIVEDYMDTRSAHLCYEYPKF
ncbi:hypothetical protein QBC34DRAFT_443795 [Podospora aff. communis PSN243]|uniref:Tyrosinase copper-binding domain-containing protein n=1 Tax=Podospora aff. communis PSN243 TaxID=3040156 RepID=A0AAV9G2J4_9PEZI|nr:hypothetical protein QBC34DRAFT_443795 [Podospora aff. communis PSN243]